MWPIRLPCAGSKFTKIRQHEIPSVWGFQRDCPHRFAGGQSPPKPGTVPLEVPEISLVMWGTVPGYEGDCPRVNSAAETELGPPRGIWEGLSPEKTGGNWRDCPRKIPKMRLRRCRLSQISRQTSDLVLESKFTSGRNGKSKPRI